MEKPERKRSFGKPERRWENNIKVNLKDICWVDVDSIHLAQDNWWAVVSRIRNLQIP